MVSFSVLTTVIAIVAIICNVIRAKAAAQEKS